MVIALGYSAAASQVNIGAQILPYSFFYPNLGGNPFYVGVPNSIPDASDQAILSQLLAGGSGSAVPASAVLHGSLPSDFRFHDISSSIPQYVHEKLGTSESAPGPNCYHVVMSAILGDRFEDRYVHDEELAYYFTRYFQVAPSPDMLGSALIYTRNFAALNLGAPGRFFVAAGEHENHVGEGYEGLLSGMMPFEMVLPRVINPSRIPAALGASHEHVPRPSAEPAIEPPIFNFESAVQMFNAVAKPDFEQRYIRSIDSGQHGALMLLAGMVFQKGCYGDWCGYRIVPATAAMSSIEIKADKWSPPPQPENDHHYIYTAYFPSKGDPFERFGFDAELSAKIEAYLPTMRYYIERFRKVKDLRWEAFRKSRIDLLTIENMWGLVGRVNEMLRKDFNTMTALLRISPQAAEDFLELTSLQWQYQAMVDKFWPFRDTWSQSKVKEELATLYREKYFHPESEEFRLEVIAHLRSRGVSEDRWEAIISGIVEQIRDIDPVKFSRFDGSQGIKFFDILDAAIGQ